MFTVNKTDCGTPDLCLRTGSCPLPRSPKCTQRRFLISRECWQRVCSVPLEQWGRVVLSQRASLRRGKAKIPGNIYAAQEGTAHSRAVCISSFLSFLFFYHRPFVIFTWREDGKSEGLLFTCKCRVDCPFRERMRLPLPCRLIQFTRGRWRSRPPVFFRIPSVFPSLSLSLSGSRA